MLTSRMVWVLAITQEEGVLLQCFTNLHLAQEALSDYCKEFWEQEHGKRAMPDDYGSLIEEYFEGLDHEWADIEECEIEGDDEGNLKPGVDNG